MREVDLYTYISTLTLKGQKSNQGGHGIDINYEMKLLIFQTEKYFNPRDIVSFGQRADERSACRFHSPPPSSHCSFSGLFVQSGKDSGNSVACSLKN